MEIVNVFVSIVMIIAVFVAVRIAFSFDAGNPPRKWVASLILSACAVPLCLVVSGVLPPQVISYVAVLVSLVLFPVVSAVLLNGFIKCENPGKMVALSIFFAADAIVIVWLLSSLLISGELLLPF